MNEEIALNTTEKIDSIDTLSLSRVLYLRQGSRLSLKIWQSSKHGYTIDEGSNWSFVMLGKVAMTYCESSWEKGGRGCDHKKMRPSNAN